jgi:hypothetical protein
MMYPPLTMLIVGSGIPSANVPEAADGLASRFRLQRDSLPVSRSHLRLSDLQDRTRLRGVTGDGARAVAAPDPSE